MASLATQLLLVVSLVFLSTLVVYRIRCDEARIWFRLSISQEHSPMYGTPARTYYRMNLNEKEEENMVDQFIYPRRGSNTL
jgi:hypothetical protein